MLFRKCYFDAQEVGTQKECDRISCDWVCIVKDQGVFCPEKCNNCVVCKVLTKVYDELKSAYFFSARKDIPYQPILWWIFTDVTDKNDKIIFRIEIGKTVKAFNLVCNGDTC